VLSNHRHLRSLVLECLVIELKTWVPDRGHRAQLLHLVATHYSTNGIQSVIYTVASPSGHLHSLYITFAEDLCVAWIKLLERLHTRWGTETPEAMDDWGRAVDAHTVDMSKKLRAAMVEFVARTGMPLPVLRYVKPLLIGTWNQEKVGVDVRTRELKNVQVANESLGPQLYFFDRYFKMIMLNIHRLLAIAKAYVAIQGGKIKSFPQFRAYMHAQQGCFQDFMGRVGEKLSVRFRISTDSAPVAPTAFVPQLFRDTKNRRAYYDSGEPLKHRLQGNGHHRRLDMEAVGKTHQWCALCSGSFDATDQGKSESERLGHRSQFACIECGEGTGSVSGTVYLCKDRHFSLTALREAGVMDTPTAAVRGHELDKVNCWTLWHSAPNLTDLHSHMTTTMMEEKQAQWSSQLPAPKVTS
jgi:hypothetical protein